MSVQSGLKTTTMSAQWKWHKTFCGWWLYAETTSSGRKVLIKVAYTT